MSKTAARGGEDTRSSSALPRVISHPGNLLPFPSPLFRIFFMQLVLSVLLPLASASDLEESQVPILTWDQFTRVENSTKILGLKQVLWNTNMENSRENENSRALASPRGEGGAEFQQQHRGLSACSRKLALHLASKQRVLPLTHTIQKTGIGKRPWYATYPCLVCKGRTVVQREGVPFQTPWGLSRGTVSTS